MFGRKQAQKDQIEYCTGFLVVYKRMNDNQIQKFRKYGIRKNYSGV